MVTLRREFMVMQTFGYLPHQIRLTDACVRAYREQMNTCVSLSVYYDARNMPEKACEFERQYIDAQAGAISWASR